MSKKDGRTLLIESIKNAWSGVVGIFKAAKEAWSEIFPAPSIVRLYNIIEAINKFSEKLRLTDKDSGELTDTAKKLKRTFKGLFAIIDVIVSLTGGAFKIAFKIVSGILSLFNLNILDVTANVGDALVAFRDWFKSTLDIGAVFTKIKEPVQKIITKIKEWIESLKDSENLPEDIAKGLVSGFNAVIKFIKSKFSNIWGWITDAFSGAKDNPLSPFIEKLKSGGNLVVEVLKSLGKMALEKVNEILVANGFSAIPIDMISGFIQGIKDGATNVFQSLISFANSIIQKVKDVLGIHSPSTVFMAIGGFIIAGLLAGLASNFPQVKEFFQNLGTNISEVLGKIDFSAIFSALIGAGLIIGIFKLASALDSFASPFAGIGDILDEASKSVKSFNLALKAEAIKSIATSILILVGSIAILTMLDTTKMLIATGAIIVMLGAIAGVLIVINKMGKEGDVKLAKFSGLMLSLAGALAIMAIAMRILGGMEREQVEAAGLALAAMALFFTALTIMSKYMDSGLKDMGSDLLKIAGTVVILAIAAKMLGGMHEHDMVRAGIALAAIAAFIAILMTMSMIPGKNFDKIGSMLLKVAGALIILAVAARIFGSMNEYDMIRAGIAIGALVALITTMMIMTKFAPNRFDKIGSIILAVAGSIAILAIAAKIFGSMSWEGLGKAGAAIVVLSGVMIGLMAATKLASVQDLKGVGVTLLMVSLCIGILAAVAIILGIMPLKALAKGIVAVSILAAMMAIMIRSLKGAKNIYKTVTMMALAMAVMVAGVAVLATIQTEKLIVATAAMSLLMYMFSNMVKSTKKANKGIGSLIVMAVVIAELAGIVYLLSTLPVENVLGVAGSLSLLLTAMSGAMFILSKSGSVSIKTIGSLMLMGVVILELAGILWIINQMDVTPSIDSVIALSIFLGALVGVTALLGLLGPIMKQAYVGIGSLALMGVVVAELAVVLWLMNALDVNPSMETVLALSTLLLAMSASLILLSIVGATCYASFIGILALAALIVAIGGLMVGIGALATQYPQLEEFINTALPLLEKIGYGLGSFFGGIVAGFSEAVMDTLPKLGTALSEFMINATPFIVGIKMVDFTMLEGIATLTAAILLLTAADLINGITSFLMGGSSFADLGTELSLFMMNAMPFILAASMIDPAIMDGVKSLAEAILILTGANLLEQLTSWLGGEASLAGFGEDLAKFGPSLATFAESVSDLSDDQLNAMKIAAESGKLLAEMAATFPNSGGLLGKIFGENDADTFGTQLEGFGKSLMAYGKSVEGIDAYVDCIASSVEASKGLVDLADNIPNSGGFLADMIGDNTMDVFGNQLAAYGLCLMLYGAAVRGIADYTDAIDASVSASKGLVDLAGAMPNSGGFAGTIIGDNTMDSFGEQLKTYGEALMTYGATVSGGESGTGIGSYLTGIKASITASQGLADVAATAKDIGKWDAGKSEFVKFGENIVKFGGLMCEFGSIASEIDTTNMNAVTTSVGRLTTLISTMSETDFDGADSFKEAIDSLAETGVDDFIDVFENSDTDVKNAAEGMIKTFARALKDKADKITSASKSVLKEVISTIRAKYESFYKAGEYLVKGFANGIKDSSYKAEAKARAMAKAAATAAEDELDINSPSKVFRKIGKSIPEGFAQGIDRMSGVVTDSSVQMAKYAVNGVRDSIAKISNFIDSGIDAQPTIRPVLDLSDVEANASSISEIFGSGPSVRVLSNVRSISSMMNRRSQNGNNDDVVSAIDKLNKNLGKVGNTTYNSIGGITYDDGSNISDAIKTIVRAVKVERRT